VWTPGPFAEELPSATGVDRAAVTFVTPYRSPRNLWGIGLNYVAHAGDLAESVPTEPASFTKGDNRIIGPR
jgi:2-keto-4-pentenoate hydratase/2-oxohepta-3-ene-1,7-dioic acid hydratase in catechol pathway